MLEVVLIRPGATDYDKSHRIQGTLNIPLNADGTREVARTIDEMRSRGLEVIYSSDSEPANQTAEALAKGLGVKLKRLDNMQNLDMGLWQGMLVEEIKRKQPKIYRQWQERPESVCPPEGEMLEQARERAHTCLKRLFKKHRDGRVGLVVPEPMASVVACLLDQGQMGDLWKASDDHGSWEAIPIGPQAMAHVA